jgi:hypothetical protein
MRILRPEDSTVIMIDHATGFGNLFRFIQAGAAAQGALSASDG